MRTAHQRKWDWRRWSSYWSTTKVGFFGAGEALSKLPPNHQVDRMQQDSQFLPPSLPGLFPSKQSHGRMNQESCCKQEQQQAGAGAGIGIMSTTQPNISGGLDQVGGQQMPPFGIDINVTGGVGRQNQYNQQQEQQQQLQNRGQNQFRGQRGFANRGRQHPAAGGFGGMGRGRR
jgi:hypothetical protein